MNGTLGFLSAAILLTAGCMDRKPIESDAAPAGEAGVRSDVYVTPPVDSSLGDHADTGNVAVLDGSSTPIDGPFNSGPEASIDLTSLPDSGPDALLADQAAPGMEAGVDVPLDTQRDVIIQPTPDLAMDNPILQGPDSGPDLGTDVPIAPDLGPDLAPTGCVIGGTAYANGDHNPSNSCQLCKLAASKSAWSNTDEGTQCGTGGGMFCNSGACKSGCYISGTFYAASAPNPSNPCQVCQSSSPSSWSQATNGASCSSSVGQICNAGSCQTGCWIGGGFVGSGAANPSNTCQICAPTKSTSAWSNNDAATAVSCGSCGGTASCTNMTLGPCSKTAQTYWQDSDGDGYGNPLVASVSSCTPIPGWVTNSGDCSDADSTWYCGRTRCSTYTDPNELDTCTSNGTVATSSCLSGCAGGQCRSYATVGTAGSVTCGALTCSTSVGCSFVAPDVTPPSCGTAAANWFETCDGPNDCPSGQVCCHILPLAGWGTAEQTSCITGACPYSNMGGYGELVCDPNNPVCPSGTTCQTTTSFLSIYICK